MLEVFDKDRVKIAILQNACNIQEEELMNSISTLTFSLPYNDPKNKLCQPFNYVKSLKGNLYRIMPSELSRDDTGNMTYQCEHVIATLIDNVLFGYHVVGNLGYYTRNVIEYILSKQLKRNWVLGRCAFSRQFEYGWEQETLLSALWSVPKPFAESFIFRFDTSVYPWVLHLDRLDMNIIPEVYIRNRKNMLKITKKSDPKNICTRIYPLGYGEGVNQLGIKEVNNGCPYLQSPSNLIQKYGVIERVWIDRRYEDANSLKGAAESMLRELEQPYTEYEAGFTLVGNDEFSKAEVGKVCRVIDTETGIDFTTCIKGIVTNFEDVEKSTLQIANKAQDIASTIADMADRQRIEMAYSQGATQLYEKSVVDNASNTEGVEINFIIPSDMRIVNKVLAKITMNSFRAYSKASSSTQTSVYSSSSGGGCYTSTSSGGGTYSSTGSGGGCYSSTSSGGGEYVTTGIDQYIDTLNGHDHGIEPGTPLAIYGGQVAIKDSKGNVTGYAVGRNDSKPACYWVKSGDHEHQVQIQDHTHDFEVQDHSHDFEIQDHTHNVEIQSHQHSTTIPGHDHDITPTIAYFGNPSFFSLYIGDRYIGQYQTRDLELDVTRMLLDSRNKIPRDQWLKLKVIPNDLAHIQIDLHVQGFVQSRGDNTV